MIQVTIKITAMPPITEPEITPVRFLPDKPLFCAGTAVEELVEEEVLDVGIVNVGFRCVVGLDVAGVDVFEVGEVEVAEGRKLL